MRRKLVKQGSATYTISLPIEWVKRFNLKPGEEIEIEETGMQLIISSIRKQKKYEKITFDLSKIPGDLSKEFVVSLYKYGIKDAEVTNFDKNQAELIKEMTSSTIGLEIISQNKQKLELLDLSIPDEESLFKAEQQLYWRLLYMLDRILDNKSTVKEIKEIDLEINKLTFFIQRNISTRYSNKPDNFLIYEEVSSLEALGDSLKYLKTHSKEIDERFIKKIISILEIIRVTEFKLENYLKAHQTLSDLEKNAEQTQKMKDNFALANIHIYKNLKQIFDINFTLNINKLKN